MNGILYKSEYLQKYAAVNKNNYYYSVFLKRETIHLELRIYSGCPGQHEFE